MNVLASKLYGLPGVKLVRQEPKFERFVVELDPSRFQFAAPLELKVIISNTCDHSIAVRGVTRRARKLWAEDRSKIAALLSKVAGRGVAFGAIQGLPKSHT